jgi:uncharacterized protein YoxC
MLKPVYINLVIAVAVFVMQVYVLITSKRAYKTWNVVFHLLNERIKRIEKLTGIHYEEEEVTKNGKPARLDH